MWRFMTVLAQWLFLWLLTVTLGFVGLRLAAEQPGATFGTWSVQFLRYLEHLVRGDLGVSTRTGHAVIEMVVAGLPIDLMLGGGALLVAWIGGAAWGLLAAARASFALGTWLMRLARGFVSVSVVVLVALAGLLVSSAARWSMVAGGMLWLPMLALAMPYAAQMARAAQRSVLAALASEPVFMARAKGLPRRSIWARYVLPAAWSPATTLGPMLLASVLTSVVVIENLIGVAGTGRFFIAAARQQDYPVIVGLGVVYSTLLIVVNLGADLLRGAAHDSNAAPVREAL